MYLLPVLCKQYVMTTGELAAKLSLNDLKEECYLNISLQQKLFMSFCFPFGRTF